MNDCAIIGLDSAMSSFSLRGSPPLESEITRGRDAALGKILTTQ